MTVYASLHQTVWIALKELVLAHDVRDRCQLRVHPSDWRSWCQAPEPYGPTFNGVLTQAGGVTVIPDSSVKAGQARLEFLVDVYQRKDG